MNYRYVKFYTGLFTSKKVDNTIPNYNKQYFSIVYNTRFILAILFYNSTG